MIKIKIKDLSPGMMIRRPDEDDCVITQLLLSKSNLDAQKFVKLCWLYVMKDKTYKVFEYSSHINSSIEYY